MSDGSIRRHSSTTTRMKEDPWSTPAWNLRNIEGNESIIFSVKAKCAVRRVRRVRSNCLHISGDTNIVAPGNGVVGDLKGDIDPANVVYRRLSYLALARSVMIFRCHVDILMFRSS
jgi:hypothetical protein